MDGNNVVMLQKADSSWLVFEKPVDIVQTDKTGKIRTCLARIDEAVGKGLFAAGFIAYEAAAGFDKALRTHKLKRTPLVWFGLYREVTELPDLPSAKGKFEVGNWEMSVSEWNIGAR